VKIHLNFATSELARSVDFYSTLLDAAPIKLLPDYALFITERPGLELALDVVDSAPLIGHDHYGIFVESAGEVESAIERLQAAGLASQIERATTCCYANQTKVWATDPMGRRWEIYTVHEETGEPDACCTA
jgi:catechol 2,3-dioxygenase-like lactoylglutathione lyase family enzyme